MKHTEVENMENRKPKFTVIVTAYNIEKYISDCITSLKAQNFSDFECIIIDDGSTDGTFSTVQKSISDDERFTLLTVSHGGPQKAKNEGLKRVHGEYVLFADGDDTLHPDCLLRCSENACDCDLLIFGINYQEFSDGVLISEHKAELVETEFASGAELADWYIANHKLLLYSNANKCYKTDVLKRRDIRFRDNLSFGEDRLFNFNFLEASGRIKTLTDALYNYRRINRNSLTSVFRPHYIDELIYLHTAKADCMTGLCASVSSEDKEAFIRYDIRKAVYDAFWHIAEHMDELSDSEIEAEILYLSSRKLPEYFYSDKLQVRENLIDYINSILFPADREVPVEEVSAVAVLGSTRCRYRVEGAFRKFGKTKYICCGGNISDYKDEYGHALTESEYMGNYLKKLGVSDVMIENQSKSTKENIINAASMTAQDDNVVVVTGAFHKIRTEQIIKSIGLGWKVFSVFGPNTRPDNWYMTQIGITQIISELERMNESRTETF